MENSKLYQSLSTLNIYEQNRFFKFLQSPYFNVNENMLIFYGALSESLKVEENTPPSKETIWSLMYIDTNFDDRRFRKYSSDLLKLFEQFLAQENFQSNPVHQAKYLLESIANKRIDKLYNSSIKTAKRLSETQIERSASYYFYQYEFEKSIYNITDFEINRSQVSNIEQIAENLDHFYLAEKLRYYCTILSRQNIIRHDYSILFMDEIIKHVDKQDYSKIPPIKIYNQILKLNLQPNVRAHYDNLKISIKESILNFPEQEAKEIFDSAINYVINRINKGKSEFLSELFELYKEGIQKELLYINNELSPWAFKNVILSALRLKEFDWVENFIHNYQSKLNPKYRDNALSFNLAQLHFYKKDYKKVIEQLQQVEYDDLTYSLNSKTFLMGAYYELDDIEPLISLLDSFRAYLNRNKQLTESRKKIYINMINIVKKLSKLQSHEKEKIQKLKNEIESVNAIASKNWILEKIAELES